MNTQYKISLITSIFLCVLLPTESSGMNILNGMINILNGCEEKTVTSKKKGVITKSENSENNLIHLDVLSR